jgi:hypothetical protein
LRYPHRIGYTCRNSSSWAPMKNEPRPFSKYLLDLLRDDPEWTSYVASLSPSMPLRRAVEEYLRFVKERVGLTPEEIDAADRILGLMEERGFSSPDEIAEAVARGKVNLPALADALGRKPRTA